LQPRCFLAFAPCLRISPIRPSPVAQWFVKDGKSIPAQAENRDVPFNG
jgi:hypothetical protein